MYICFISRNLESLIDVLTCILSHVGDVLLLNTFFPMSILQAHAILMQVLSSFTFKLPSNKGLYLVAKPTSQTCPL